LQLNNQAILRCTWLDLEAALAFDEQCLSSELTLLAPRGKVR
jgi:hypothetical protein